MSKQRFNGQDCAARLTSDVERSLSRAFTPTYTSGTSCRPRLGPGIDNVNVGFGSIAAARLREFPGHSFHFDEECARILRLPEMKERLAALGPDVVGGTPEELAAVIHAETVLWGDFIRKQGFKLK